MLIVPPLTLYVPVMVKVTPGSTVSVPAVIVSPLIVWLLLIFKVPLPLIEALLLTGIVVPPDLLNCNVPAETVVRPV